MRFTLPEPISEVEIIETYEYIDGPKLFTCEALSGQKYIVNWIDTTEINDVWFYVPVSDTRFSMVRSGKISLRDCILLSESNFVWEVVTSNVNNEITINLKKCIDIVEDELPDIDSYLDFNEGTLPEKKDIVTESIRSRRDILDLSLEIAGTHKNEIEAETLGNILVLTQELNNHIALGKGRHHKGKIPRDIKEKSKLKTVGFFAASFGVRLQSEATSGMMEFTDTTDTLRDLMSLFSAGDHPNTLKDIVKKINNRATKSYYELLRKFNENRIEVNVEWASPTREVSTTKLSRNTIINAMRIIGGETHVEKKEIVKNGKLVGVDTETKNFHVITDEGDHYKGKLGRELKGMTFNLPAKVRVDIEEETRTNLISEKKTNIYTLQSIQLLQD